MQIYLYCKKLYEEKTSYDLDLPFTAYVKLIIFPWRQIYFFFPEIQYVYDNLTITLVKSSIEMNVFQRSVASSTNTIQ